MDQNKMMEYMVNYPMWRNEAEKELKEKGLVETHGQKYTFSDDGTIFKVFIGRRATNNHVPLRGKKVTPWNESKYYVNPMEVN